MTIKIYLDRKPIMVFLDWQSAEEYKERHSPSLQKRMEIRIVPSKNGGQK
jgi:hypothetical protein